MGFPEILRKEIASKNLSISEFERRAGLSRNSVQNIILGKSKKPSAKTLQAISFALGYSLSELTSLMPDNPLDNNKRENVDLNSLEICSSHLIKKLIEMKVDLSLDEYHRLLRDIYAYQNENPNKQEIDDVFIQWIIKKNLHLH